MIADRPAVLRSAIQAASPLALVVAAYLFFAGHNQPGGGFAAGLVLGAVVALRVVAGLAQPAKPIPLLTIGTIIVAAVGLAPIFAGDLVLDQVIWEFEAPVLGKIKAGTALIFDAGVTIIVVGLVVALLEGLGADQLAKPPSVAAAAERERHV